MKDKMQFSQKITLASAIFSMVIVVILLTANFILLWNNRQSMSQETVQAISVYGGITSTLTFGGYCVLTACRDMSRNKHADKIKDGDQ